MASPGQTIQIANAADRCDERTKSAAKCGQICGGPEVELRAQIADSTMLITN
jgi:hypothetical protein